MRTSIVFLIALFTGAALRPVLAQRPDVIHGRVLGSDSNGVANASVVVTSRPDSTVKRTRTDARGEYSITFENAGSGYLVTVTMLGYAPQRRTVVHTGTDSIPAVNFRLTQVAAQLGAVRSTGERPKPPRSENSEFGSPGGAVSFTDLSRGTTGDVTGDLTAALSTLPGITVIPSATGGLPTVSAFGQSSDQNNVVLNGLGFGGTPPRDGVGVAVISSNYDPARGFAGVQLSVRINQGSNLKTRTIHTTVDAPALQVTTPIAERFGSRYDQQVVSGVLSGPIIPDRSFYSFSYQVNHRTSELSSLYNSDPAALLALHISPDSIARLFTLLSAEGIPVTASAVPGARATTEGRFATRLDFTPGSFIAPTSIPASGGQLSHRDGWIQFNISKYLPRGFLNEVNANVSGNRDNTDPYLLLPSARVLVSSQMGDGSVGVSPVQVGGASTPRVQSSAWSTEFRDQISRYTWDRHHLFQLTLDGSVDHFSIDQAAGLGTYTYNSLADFADSLPASYSRTLTGRVNEGQGETWSVGLGDIYNPTQYFRAQFGVRAEGNHLGIHPAFNPAIDSIFGLRTDHVPSTVAVMPMVGFTWNTLGSISFPGTTQKFPRGSISGGVREYRGSITTRSIDNYARQTGLPDAIQQLYCIGGAAPAPRWSSFSQSASAVPTQCADGSLGSAFAQVAPPVALFDPSYSLSRSWRPTLNINYNVTQNFNVSGGGTYALNLDQPGIYDVNFVPAAQFTLASEGNRPVFVSQSSIVPATGAMSWTQSRRSTAFAHVAESRSDIRSEVRMLTGGMSIRPSIIGPNQSFWILSLNYAYSLPREQVYGFTGTTADDPTIKSWTPGSGAHHVVTMSFTNSLPRLLNYTITARAQSGLPFTPIVAGDVNGDGYSNDRAFVFNPSATADSSLASAMTRLLGTGPSWARDCLHRQVGVIAGRNSCTGPWSVPLLTATLSPDSYRLGLGNRGTLSLLFTNLLGGLDQLVHGADKLHGWGQQAFPDPTLLTVRGYDPTANAFKYTVNPLFGSSTVFRNTFRSPFVMTIDFRMEVGPDRETQFVELALRPKAGENASELTADQIKAKLTPAQPFNPIDRVVQQKDSLKLTPEQVDTLTKLSHRYATFRDSTVTSLARYLVSLHGDYRGEEVRARWHAAALATYTAARNLAAEARPIFNAEQMAKLKANLALGNFIAQDYSADEIRRLLRSPMASIP